jgi:thiamine biosynthesis protein ThiC
VVKFHSNILEVKTHRKLSFHLKEVESIYNKILNSNMVEVAVEMVHCSNEEMFKLIIKDLEQQLVVDLVRDQLEEGMDLTIC